MLIEKVIETDILVIGGGIAGCFVAIKARESGAQVTLVDKGYVGKSGETPFAKHYLAFNPEWGHELKGWMHQVSFMGEYMNNPEWTKVVLNESFARFQDMISWGVEFLKYDNDNYVFWPARSPEGLSKLPMQSIRMVPKKHAMVYREQAIKSGIRIIDRVMVTDLLKQDGEIVGAIGLSTDKSEFYAIKAKATIIAAGSAALKPNGTPLHAVTGDGEAIAYRAGAEITGKEWNDCHPSRAEFPAWQWSPRKEVTVAKSAADDYRGLPPKVNALGEKIFYGAINTLYIDDVFEVDAGRAPIWWEFGSGSADYHRLVAGPEGQPRKKIDLEAEKLGRVRMVSGSSLGMSVHLTEGIWPIDTSCATQLPGLYAAGDSLGARFGGARYANMGIALASCAVSGARAGQNAAEYALHKKTASVDTNEIERLKRIVYLPTERNSGFSPGWITQVLQNTMMPYWILYLKHGDRLQSALTQVEFIRDRVLPKMFARDPHELRLACETKNMVLSSEMKLRASIFRTESRGTHIREDYPLRDDPSWLAWIKIKEEQGQMKLLKEPIPMKWWPDLNISYQERYPVRFPGEEKLLEKPTYPLK